ncbi:hypothetical protein SISNIDRAFT_391618, partial [Sistotremastrum niveocremeum HHB9708]
MPLPHLKEAPYFDGKSRHLSKFLDEYEALATRAALTDEQKCKQVINYAKTSEGDFWTTLDGYKTNNWANLRLEITASYPGAGGTARYTVEDLRDLAKSQSRHKIRHTEALAEYTRQYRAILGWLEANEKV